MAMQMRTRAFTLGTAVAATLASASLAHAQQRFEETVATSARGEVVVVNTAGNVRVSGWSRNQIHVSGTLGQGAERVEITGDANRTQIRVVLPRQARNVRGTDLHVRLPAGKSVTVRTTSADVIVEGVSGAVRGNSTSGDVTVSGSPAAVEGQSTSGDVRVNVGATARVRAQTTSGDINIRGTVREHVDVESVSGDVDVGGSTPEVRARTVSGDLALRGVSGRVSANTVSGDAVITGSRVQFGAFETVSGNLRYDGELPRGAAFNVQSHSGNVELRLAGRVDAEFDVRTFGGSIRNQFGPETDDSQRRGPGREIRFTAGGGGGLITLKTFSGNVSLLRR